MSRRDQAITQDETFRSSFPQTGPTCACRDLDCSCQVEGVPMFAQPAQQPTPVAPLAAEAMDLMLDVVREVNRLQYPLPQRVTLSINAMEDFLRRSMPVPF